MKKILSFFRICGAFLLKGCVLVVVTALCIHLTLEIKTSIKVSGCMTTYDDNYLKSGNCYVSQYYSMYGLSAQKALERTNKVLDRFPEKVQETIKNNWVFVFTPDVPDAVGAALRDQTTSDVSGITVADVKTIFVLTDYEQLGEYVLTHEICHAVGHEYANIDYSSEFGEIYQLYKNSYQEPIDFAIKGYATSSQVEFFASTLSVYISDPELLCETAPEVYEFMSKLLASDMDGGIVNEVKDSCLRCWRVIGFFLEEQWLELRTQ